MMKKIFLSLSLFTALLTSNVASDLIQSVCGDPETRPEVSQLEATIRPELLNRTMAAKLEQDKDSAYLSYLLAP